jgi:hypothetical protein
MRMGYDMHSFGNLARFLSQTGFPLSTAMDTSALANSPIPALPNKHQAATFRIRMIKVALVPAADFHA